MHGIEVVNGRSYYPEAHEWALEKNLTFMGTSDIHAPSMLEQSSPDQHRSMTLVFARGKTLAAVKEALVAGRTLVWYERQLIGRKEYLDAMFNAATTIGDIEYGQDDTVRFRLTNHCDVALELERAGKLGPKSVSVPPHASTLIRAKVPASSEPHKFEYAVSNFLVAPAKGLPVSLEVPPQITIQIGVDTEG
jgi:hypothetical protein